MKAYLDQAHDDKKDDIAGGERFEHFEHAGRSVAAHEQRKRKRVAERAENAHGASRVHAAQHPEPGNTLSRVFLHINCRTEIRSRSAPTEYPMVFGRHREHSSWCSRIGVQRSQERGSTRSASNCKHSRVDPLSSLRRVA